MFSIEYTLDLCLKHKQTVVVHGSVFMSSDELAARITSVQVEMPTIDGKRVTCELKGILHAADLNSMEEALCERYAAIHAKFNGRPEDYPRDDGAA